MLIWRTNSSTLFHKGILKCWSNNIFLYSYSNFWSSQVRSV